MKKTATVILAAGLMLAQAALATDIPLTSMTKDTNLGMDSLLYSVDDPGGTPVDRAITMQEIADTVIADLQAADIPDLSAIYQPLDTMLTSISALSDPNVDRIAFWDDSTGAWAWLEPGDGLAISAQALVLDIMGLTVESAPDSSSDYAIIYDASSGAPRRVLLDNWPGGDQSYGNYKILYTNGAGQVQEYDMSTNGGEYIKITADGHGLTSESAQPMPWTESFVLSDPTDSDDGLWFKAPAALTVSGVDAIIDPADSSESISVDIQECNSDGDSCATILSSAITAANTNTSGTVSDTSIAAGAWIKVVIGAPTGTVSRLNITMRGTR